MLAVSTSSVPGSLCISYKTTHITGYPDHKCQQWEQCQWNHLEPEQEEAAVLEVLTLISHASTGLMI